MAQKFLSPGVFTREIDQSFLAQGVAGIGAVLIGRTLQGPAFVPTVVGSFDDFAAIFGNTDPKHQMPYAAKNYLKNSATLTVVRVLGHADGTTTNNGYQVGSVIGIVDSASAGQVLAVVHASGGYSNTTIAGVALDANNFVFKVGTTFAVTASFLTSSDNYVGKVLNTDPTLYSTYGHYLYKIYPYAVPAVSASWQQASGSGVGLNTFYSDFTEAATPWVKSQVLGGTDFNLFKFHTKGHGDSANKTIKVTVSNVKPSPAPSSTPYGTFDVTVRDFNDTDQRPTVLETFVGLTLDPDSPNFIGRRIGDSYEQFSTQQRKFQPNGTYPSRSRYIWVELATNVDSAPQALPWGFRGYVHQPFGSGSAETNLPYVLSQKDRQGNFDPNVCWGVSFVSGGIYDRMRAVPDGASVYAVSDTDFTLANLSASFIQGRQQWFYASPPTPHTAVYSSASLYKFTMPFQGGFGGVDIRVSDFTYLGNTTDETDIGVVSLKRAVDCVANPDAFDMNLIAVPGVHNLKVTDRVRAMVNDRQDVFYIMDVTGSSVDEVVQQLNSRNLDDNYTACYYPDLKYDDQTSKRVVRVAPSVAMMGVMAYNDRVGQPWFAPAGLTRGGLKQFSIIDVTDRLNFGDRDTLYSNRINAIATFPQEGIVAWGQKTLQVAASALDRINVRRLLIYAKKTVAAAAKVLVFEPNNPATWQRFTNSVNPILEKVRQANGIERFKIIMDTSTNTPDVVDRNTMVGKIFLQPTKVAEFIDLPFIITNAGVAFGD
jgi:hypothetical protein